MATKVNAKFSPFNRKLSVKRVENADSIKSLVPIFITERFYSSQRLIQIILVGHAAESYNVRSEGCRSAGAKRPALLFQGIFYGT